MRKIAIKDIRKQDYFYSEAIKTLRTNIQLSGKSIKTILVTSCFPNEGKSDVALSLVQELSSIGKKVLLIDGDIRKSDFVIRLGIEQEVIGLSQFLSGQAEIKDLICSTNYPNLHIIFGGPVAPNPSGLLSEDLFRTFMKEIRNYYDYIVVDTPPVGSVIDAAVIARYCDGGIFVIEPGVVSYKLAQKCIRQIEKSGCRVIGAVMNKVDTKRDKYYSSCWSASSSTAFTLPVCTETVSSFFPRKLSPRSLNTVASLKMRSSAHRSVESSLKSSRQRAGFLLLVKTMLKLPSLL